jgi:hypothetical protein
MNINGYPFSLPPKPELRPHLLVMVDEAFVASYPILERPDLGPHHYASISNETISEMVDFLVDEIEVDDESEIDLFFSWGGLITNDDGDLLPEMDGTCPWINEDREAAVALDLRIREMIKEAA